MSEKPSAEESNRRYQRIVRRAFCVAVVGVLLGFALGDQVDGPLGAIAGLLTAGAVITVFVATPFGIWLGVRVGRERMRNRTRASFKAHRPPEDGGPSV